MALFCLLRCAQSYAVPATGQSQQADVLITGGMVYDGSAAKPFIGDVAIAGPKDRPMSVPRLR